MDAVSRESQVPAHELESWKRVFLEAERFIRTLKEQLLWVRPFDTVEELRVALLDFKERYNREWLCERHGHQTPVAVRAALKATVKVAA